MQGTLEGVPFFVFDHRNVSIHFGRRRETRGELA